MKEYDVVVIGGGPAGLSSAISAKKNGAKVLLIEREDKLGGILKQCIHDGFGLTRYGEKLTGPEYAKRDIDAFHNLEIDQLLNSFVTRIEKKEKYNITISNREGIQTIESKTIVFATGCRERTSKQVFIHGERPSGVFNAGNAQNLVNILGYVPTKRCVILGSGDIGLIMARRLTLEGAKVLKVLEIKPQPSGLKRNIRQCLDDFNIPLCLSTTVSRIIGKDRVEAVETVKVDENLNYIKGTEEIIECDSLILSVGLIPENELLEKLDVYIDNRTKGALVDNNLHTLTSGIFVAGNCLNVNDLVDYVSENGEVAGKSASEYAKEKTKRELIKIETSNNIFNNIPQYIDINSNRPFNAYLRSREDYGVSKITVTLNEKKILERKYNHIRSAETTKISIDLSKEKLDKDSVVRIQMEEEK